LNYTNYRFYTRNLFTKYGKIQDLKVPRVRNGGFRSAILSSFSKPFSGKQSDRKESRGGEGYIIFGGLFCDFLDGTYHLFIGIEYKRRRYI
jgi:hypothetical protein